MKSAWRGGVLLVVQCLLVLSVAAKYSWDRERLPRAWANATPIDASLPVRGRYVSLQLHVDGRQSGNYQDRVRLGMEHGRLVGHSAASGGQRVWRRGETWLLAEPIAFFIPERAADPSHVAPGEEIWVEVSVPSSGPPRPIRLAIKKDGVLQPLDLR